MTDQIPKNSKKESNMENPQPTQTSLNTYYRGFIGCIAFDKETQLFMGQTVNYPEFGSLQFCGKTLEEAQEEFKKVIDKFHEQP